MSLRDRLRRARRGASGGAVVPPPAVAVREAPVPSLPVATGPRLRPDAAALRLRHAGGDPRPPECPLRGWLDLATPRDGIGGWIVDRHAPAEAMTLELCVDSRPVVRRHAARPRADLWADGDTDPTLTPGFLFGPDALDELAACEVDDPEARLRIRPVGHEAWLDGLALPTLGQVRRWRQASAADGGLPSAAADVAGLPLGAALDRLAQRASALLRQPLRADEATCVGFVEMLVPLEGDRQYVGGWFRARAGREHPVIVVAEGRKHAGALVVVTHARDDLPAGARAFFGVLHGSWRAEGAQDQPFVFLGDTEGAWLRANRPLRLAAPGDAQERLQWLRAALEDAGDQRRLAEFGRQLDTPSRWSPTPQRGATQGVHVGIDTVALLPGFGAFVDGWIVAAGAEVADVSLRLGPQVLDGDRGAWQVRRRADLASAFPALADRLGRAGFRAVLRGPLPADGLREEGRLAFDLDDGRRLVVPVDPACVRRLDARLPATALAARVPALAHAPWRDDFLRAWARQARDEASTGLQVVRPVHAPAIVAGVLPDAAAEEALWFDRLAAQAAQVPAGVALVLVATPAHPEARLHRGLARLRAVLGADRAGLVRVGDRALALPALEAVCDACGAGRFAFLGPDVLPEDEAWRVIAPALRPSLVPAAAERPVFLPVLGWRQGREELTREAGAFAWTREAFAAWLLAAPACLGDLAGGAGLPGADLPWPDDARPALRRVRNRDRARWAEQVDAARRDVVGSAA